MWRRCQHLCVVKADAYGHGAAACARALEAEGAPWFGVTGTEEAMALDAPESKLASC